MTGTVTTINPYTEQSIKEYQLLDKEAAQQAVDNADKRFQTWKLTSIGERAEYALKLAQVLESHQQQLAQLMTDEMGKVRAQGLEEVQLCAEICRYTAKQAGEVLADEERDVQSGRAIISYQPIGVILGIQPWNFPLYQVIRYSIANL